MTSIISVFLVLLSLFALIIAQPPADDIDPVTVTPAGLEPIVLPGSDVVYNLARYWVWHSWVHLEGTANVPRIPSQIWAAGHRVAIDIVPMPEDVDSGGRRYHLWFFRYRIPNRMRLPGQRTRMTRLREWAFGPRRPLSWQDRIVQEGPFIIQPANLQEDAIALHHSQDQPSWAVEMLGRPLWGFVVRQVGPVYLLARGITSDQWLRNIVQPRSQIIRNGAPFAIHAAVDSTDLSGKTVVASIYNAEPESWIHTGQDTRRVPQEGPWRVRCASNDDVIELFTSETQTEWVIRALGKYDPNNVSPLKDFRIIAQPPDRRDQTVIVHPTLGFFPVLGPFGSASGGVAVRSFSKSCLKINTEHFFQNTQIVEEHYVTAAAGVVRTYYGGIETLVENHDGLAPYNLAEENVGLAPHPDGLAMAEMIEVRVPGRDMPIAQIIHTDHLDFTFEGPQTRHNPLSFLLFCVYAGETDLRLNYDKLPLS